MRRLTAAVVLMTILVAAALIAPADRPAFAAPTAIVAAASGSCQQIDIRTGRCLVTAAAPAALGGGSNVGVSSGASEARPSCFSTWSNGVVPCADSRGSWSNARSCYIQPSAENPLPGSLLFEGHTDGAVYTCTPDIGNQFQTAYSFWSATPPAGPDPAQLAQQAIAALGLTAVDIGIVPEPGAASVGLVGLPVWMWVDQPSPTTWGPATSSASAGGITVTATAHVERVVWDLGDGASITCGAGTPYSDADGSSPSPDCGHVYSRTSVGKARDAYTVSATSHWVIDWAGGGASGQQDMELTADTSIRIGEAQAVITS